MELQQEIPGQSRDQGLGQLVKASGAQVVFSILPVAGNVEGRNKKTQQINT